MIESHLLQSESWAKFQEKNGHRVHIIEHQDVRGIAIVERLSFLGNYIYFPRGPLIKPITSHQSSVIREQLSKLSQEEGAGWVRVEPENKEALSTLYEAFGKLLKRAPHPVQPEETLIVTLAGSSEEWLEKMKSKTRYNVRLAVKHGVTVRFSREDRDIDGFIALIHETTSRKGISPHPDPYYRNFFQVFGGDECALALAEHEGELLAAGLLVFYSGMAHYLHGGSSSQKRDLMAPFLLHFRVMEEAKKRGCTFYDFGGVATERQESMDMDQKARSEIKKPQFIVRNSKFDEWAGITRFKQGFAPDIPTVVYPGTYDIVFDENRYAVYCLLSYLSDCRKLFRKFLSKI